MSQITKPPTKEEIAEILRTMPPVVVRMLFAYEQQKTRLAAIEAAANKLAEARAVVRESARGCHYENVGEFEIAERRASRELVELVKLATGREIE